MEHIDYAKLLAEQTHLEHLLGRVPEENVIDRMGLEARLEKVKTEIGNLVGTVRPPVRARLTFRGKPVVGSQGADPAKCMRAITENCCRWGKTPIRLACTACSQAVNPFSAGTG